MGILITSPAAEAIPDTAASIRRRRKLSEPTSLAIDAEQLLQLNFRYLSLAASCPELFGDIAAQLADTDLEQKWRMADCRFSLFSLALNDNRRWLPLLNRNFADGQLPALDLPGKTVCKDFSTSVVFLAWHFAQSRPLAAKVLLYMSDGVAEALQQIPVAHLPMLTARASNWLTPRWPQHPVFWSALLRHSRNPGSRLGVIKSLGRQLLAAETLELPNSHKRVGKLQLSSNAVGSGAKNTLRRGRPRVTGWSARPNGNQSEYAG